MHDAVRCIRRLLNSVLFVSNIIDEKSGQRGRVLLLAVIVIVLLCVCMQLLRKRRNLRILSIKKNSYRPGFTWAIGIYFQQRPTTASGGHFELMGDRLIVRSSQMHVFCTQRLFNTVCLKKNIPDIFSCNSRKHCRIFIMFGTHVTEKVSNQ